MSTHANGARAGGVDSRVSDSPFVSVRYHVDAWSGDYDQTELDVHDMLRERVAERDAILASVRDHEAVREHLVRGLHRYEPRDIVRSLHEGLSLHEQLGRVEAQIEGLQQHIEALQATRAALRELRMELRDVARSGGVAVNEQAAKLAQASRKMLALADEQHEEVAQAILQGPMQRLTDAAFEAEVATRVVESDVRTAAQHATRCRIATAEAMQELDELIGQLRPVTAERSLVEALRELLRRSPIHETARVRVIGTERRLPAMQELTLYRIVEQAVDNATRHGHSSHIDIILSFHEDRVVVLVKDDGDGFDVAATEARLGRSRALGLIEMHERAALVGTKLEVRSLIGAGTEVRVMVGANR